MFPRLFFILCGMATACAMAVAAASGHAETLPLLSHRAVYDLELARDEAGSGVADIRGLLVMEWADACDGYALSQRMAWQITEAEGAQVVTDFHVSSWESKDGLVFRFSTRSDVGGRDVEFTEGRAQLAGIGQRGWARFTKPQEREIILQPGTLFPTQHTIVLLERAAAGANQVMRDVFDGSDIESLHEVAAFIRGQLPSGSYQGIGEDDLRDLESWRVQLGFYELGSEDGAPDFQVGFRIFANGVATDVVLDYGDFALTGKLLSLDRLEDYC